MRRFKALICGLVLAASPALAGPADAPLPPGKAAGVTKAQDANMRLFYLITAAGTVIPIAGTIWELNKSTTPAPVASTTT